MRGSPKIRPERGLGPKGGDPMSDVTLKPVDLHRFWRRIEPKSMDECWVWKGLFRSGYGSVHFGGKERRAHRVSWIIHGRKIEPGKVIHHKCHNTACVNPHHLEMVTQYENISTLADRSKVGEKLRAWRASKIVPK